MARDIYGLLDARGACAPLRFTAIQAVGLADRQRPVLLRKAQHSLGVLNPNERIEHFPRIDFLMEASMHGEYPQQAIPFYPCH